MRSHSFPEAILEEQSLYKIVLTDVIKFDL